MSQSGDLRLRVVLLTRLAHNPLRRKILNLTSLTASRSRRLMLLLPSPRISAPLQAVGASHGSEKHCLAAVLETVEVRVSLSLRKQLEGFLLRTLLLCRPERKGALILPGRQSPGF
jgi:hypothetical protein